MILNEFRKVIGSRLGEAVDRGDIPIIAEGHGLRESPVDDAGVATE